MQEIWNDALAEAEGGARRKTYLWTAAPATGTQSLGPRAVTVLEQPKAVCQEGSRGARQVQSFLALASPLLRSGFER